MLLFGVKMKPVCNYDQDLNYILYQYRSLSKRKIKPFPPNIHSCKQNKQKFISESANMEELVTPLSLFGKPQKSSPYADRFYHSEQYEQQEKNCFAQYLSTPNQHFFQEELSQMVKKFALFKVQQQENLENVGDIPEQQILEIQQQAAKNEMLFQLNENEQLTKDFEKCEIEQIRIATKRTKDENFEIGENYHARTLSDERQKDINYFNINFSELKSSSSKENTTKSNIKSKTNLNNQQNNQIDGNHAQKNTRKAYVQNQQDRIEHIFNVNSLNNDEERYLQLQFLHSKSIQEDMEGQCLQQSQMSQAFSRSLNFEQKTEILLKEQEIDDKDFENAKNQQESQLGNLQSISSTEKGDNFQISYSQNAGLKLQGVSSVQETCFHINQMPQQKVLKNQTQTNQNYQNHQNLQRYSANYQSNCFQYQQDGEKEEQNMINRANFGENHQSQEAYLPIEKNQNPFQSRLNSFIRRKSLNKQSFSSLSESIKSKETQMQSRNKFSQGLAAQARNNPSDSNNRSQNRLNNPLKQNEAQQYKTKIQAVPTSQGKSYAKCFKKQKQLDEKEKIKKSQLKVKKPKVEKVFKSLKPQQNKNKCQPKQEPQVVIEKNNQQIYISQDFKDYENGQIRQSYNVQNDKIEVQDSYQQIVFQSQPLKRQLYQQELTNNNYQSTEFIGYHQKPRNQAATYDVKENSQIKLKSISGTKSDEQYNLLKLMGGSDNLKELSSLVIQPKQSCLQIQKEELAHFMAVNSISVKSQHSFDESEDISLNSSTFRFSPNNNITSFNLADALKEDSKKGVTNFNQILQKTRNHLNNYRKTQPNMTEDEDLILNEESVSQPVNFVNYKKFNNNINSLEMAVIEELESNKIMSSNTSHAQVYPKTFSDYRNHFNPRRILSKINQERGASYFERDRSSNYDKQYQSLSPSKRIEGAIQGVKSRWQKNSKRFKTKMHNF